MQASPFDLTERLAVGGMGEVWLGVHRRSGMGVAIKVLTQKEARSPEMVAAFRAEARSAASLHHPQIAWVLDYGLLPEAWEEQTDGELCAGSPFLVAEHARGGNLRSWVRQPPLWPALRQALLQLLDALAFAHARGVIHRDLKPSNVLLGTRRERRHGVLLSDFGIAHRLGAMPEPGFHPRAGTPTYMAPEQIYGDWRAYGPWTDLYALGVMTWAILQGEVPEREEVGGSLLSWQPPRIMAPAGLPRWLARLLRTDPRERFQRASDAAAALRELDVDANAPAAPGALQISPAGNDLSIHTRAATPDLTQLYLLTPDQYTQSNLTLSNFSTRVEGGVVRPLEVDVQSAEVPPPRPPATWRPPTPEAPPLALLDAGLGLLGLREAELVGRVDERDALWAQLTRVFEEGRPGVVLITGALGVGKSRLVRWLCERGEETGASLSCLSRLGVDGGLPQMLRRALRAEGLRGVALSDHLRSAPMGDATWTEDERAQITALLDESDGHGPRTAGERYALLLRLFRRLAGARALTLGLDDADAQPDGAGLARHLLSLPPEAAGPVLLVLAAPDAALDAPPDSPWGALLRRPELVHLALKPLEPSHRSALANARLRLSTALAERVAARSAGNPLFAALLVEDWVRRDALVPGGTGFELRPGEPAALPETVAALVGDQLGALERERPESDLQALEVAAILGVEVALDEWEAALIELGIQCSTDGLDRALARRLLVPGSAPGRVAFAQNMLREGLLERAKHAGRSAGHHRAAAVALTRLGRSGGETEGRLGRHRLLAGDAAGAVPALLSAARAASLTVSIAEERALLDLVEGAIPQLPEADRLAVQARLWNLRGHVAHAALGDRGEARAWLERAADAAQRTGQRVLQAECQRRLGSVIFELGDMQTALPVLREALSLAEQAGDPLMESIGALDLATVMRHAGQRIEAEAFGRQSRDIAQRAGLDDMVAINGKHSWYLDTLPTPEEKRTALVVATGELQRLCIPGHLGAALNSLGLLEIQLGLPEEGEATLRRSLRVLEEVGSSLATLPRYNLAHRQMQLGRHWEAWPMLRCCLQEIHTHRWVGLEPMVRSALAQIELLAGDGPACDAHLSSIEALWRAGGAPIPDAARNLEELARTAEGQGDRGRIAAALTLAAALYEAARLPEEAVRVRALLSVALPDSAEPPML